MRGGCNLLKLLSWILAVLSGPGRKPGINFYAPVFILCTLFFVPLCEISAYDGMLNPL